MPHTEHRKKTMRKAERAREKNRATRAGFRTALKDARAEKSATKEGAAAFIEAQTRLDKAAKHRVIHPNKAARLKSRLAKSMKGGGA